MKAHKQTDSKDDLPLSPPDLHFVDTAIVNVVNGDRQQPARAALDSGAGVSLMTESLASHLKLQRYPQHIIVEEAYGEGSSKHFVQATLQSLDDPTAAITLKLAVMPKLKASQPPYSKQDILNDKSLKDLQLADSELGGLLDLLICSIDRCKCVTQDFTYFPESRIAVTKTMFGWTIHGQITSHP